MALNGQEVICREYHFDRGASISEFTSATNATGAVSYTANTTKGVQLTVPANADRAYLHWNGRLGIPVTDLLRVEYLFQIDAWDDNTDAVLGLCSTYNADPDVIQESVWFRITGGATGRNLKVESDDNVTDISEATGLVVPGLTWMRGIMDFATGIQSIAPPGKSKGGRASIQFSMSDANGYQKHLKFNKHIDMSGYSGGLQPVFGLRQTGALSGTPTLFVKSLKVWMRQAA